jgi:glycosyltransferase involved in cell wall biosynthesis
MHYAFPSKWVQMEASRSLDFGGTAVHIPNGFDPNPYDYHHREEARRILQLPSDRQVVVVSSAALEDRRKGVAFALRALQANRDLNPFVILIGRPFTGIEETLGGFNKIIAGFIEERPRLGLLYAAADLLLFSSLADNLPITIQEAMAARTPVVAFRVGGISELVEDGKTGWLVPVGDQNALNETLRRALLSGQTKAFGERGRAFITEQYSRQKCVEKHLEVYESAIERWRAEAARS